MSGARVTGLNHITVAVTDLERSVVFYRDLLGFDLRALWKDGAYLEAGALWLCLSLDDRAEGLKRPDYTHVAFDIRAGEFGALAARIKEAAPLWRENVSEGDSLYFLDPDNHRRV